MLLLVSFHKAVLELVICEVVVPVVSSQLISISLAVPG